MSSRQRPSASASAREGPKSGGRSRLRALLTVVVLAAYALAATYAIWLSRNQINPDGIGYIRTAQYYAGGRLDLAVNSYRGPLLSWILVPAAWLKMDPLWAFKILQGALGICFAAASALLTRRLGSTISPVFIISAALLLTLPMLFGPITPDLLLTVLLTWSFARAVKLIHGSSTRNAFATGLLGGLCYLAKAYALPFFVMLLVLTYVVRYAAHRARTPRPFLACLAGLAAVAGPWIAVISLHDRALTFSSAGRLARAWSPSSRPEGDPRPTWVLHSPRAGRLTSWENPVEIPHKWEVWSPLQGLGGIKRQIETLVRCTGSAFSVLKSTEHFGLLLAGYFLAVLLVLSRRAPPTRDAAASWAWACIVVPLFISGYVLVVIQARYLWPLMGILLALAANAAVALAKLLCGVARGARDLREGGNSPARARFLLAFLFLLLSASCLYQFLYTVDTWRGPWGEAAKFGWIRDVAMKLPVRGQFASNSVDPGSYGLYVSYWRQSRFLGMFESDSPETIAGELEPFGPTYALVWNDADLCRRLEGSGLCKEVASYSNPTARIALGVFAFVHPPGASAPGPPGKSRTSPSPVGP